MTTPLHIVGGFLGSGKTTLLLAELARRGENCAVIVNDFGEAAIDATLLGGAAQLTNIAGGCVCCTAPEGLVPAIEALLTETRPDRIFVEPSGLARPSDLTDMLLRAGLDTRITLMPTVVVLDATQGAADPARLEGADIVMLSHVDLATPAQLESARAAALASWPPPLRVLEARMGVVDAEAWAWPDGARPLRFCAEPSRRDSTTGYTARSWTFPAEQRFSWDLLRSLLASRPGLARFKGIFHTDVGWFRVDVAGGRLHPQLSTHRRDSRCDAILSDGDPDEFEAGLLGTRVEARLVVGDGLELIDPSGVRLPISRAVLRGLPGQVADVGEVVPGRTGAGVRLAFLLKLAQGSQYVAVAKDGMTSTPADVAGVGDAVLVHSAADGGPLPDDQGGPLRLLAPPGSSNCQNVKGVVAVRLL